MKRLAAAVPAALLAAGALAQPAQPPPASSAPVEAALDAAPHIGITNGLIAARILPPHPDKGFYRGTRFDQAGVIASMKFRGREFYGPWFERTAPEVLDYTYIPEGIVAGPDSAISGPVEEFAPLGFAPKPGLFVKIGVGVLRQPDEKPYDHYRHYQIVDGGARTTRVARDSVTFTQTLSGTGYGYVYRKTLRLVPGRPQMVIAHVLRNTGSEPIVTTVYDHNFLRLVPGNGDIRVTFPFPVTAGAAAANPPAADLIRIEGNSVTYLRPMTDRERISFPVTGYGADARDYAIQVTDTKSGAGVAIRGDRPLVKVNIFSIDRTQAVEPYIAINVPPGAEQRWSYTYTYSAP